MSYQGCGGCRPEARRRRRNYSGASGNALAVSMMVCAATFAATTEARAMPVRENQVSTSCKSHGAVEYLTEVACPTEEYYSALAEDMRRRHPKAAKDILYSNKSLRRKRSWTRASSQDSVMVPRRHCFCVPKGPLLGHQVGRTGAHCDPARTEAIWTSPR